MFNSDKPQNTGELKSHVYSSCVFSPLCLCTSLFSPCLHFLVTQHQQQERNLVRDKEDEVDQMSQRA